MKIHSSIYDQINEFNFRTKYYLSHDIIRLIFKLIVQDYYGKIIFKHFKNDLLIKKTIHYTICRLVINDDDVDKFPLLVYLNMLINANISRKFNLRFWAFYLQLLSSKINTLRFHQRCHNISYKSSEGLKLKNLIDAWLTLCKKFNFKIYLQTHTNSKYIRAKNIIKLNEYDKYVISPIIITPFTKNTWTYIADVKFVLSHYYIENFYV